MDKFKQIVENLKSYQPKKIILFGSSVFEKENKDSDIDLLIIKKYQERPLQKNSRSKKLFA